MPSFKLCQYVLELDTGCSDKTENQSILFPGSLEKLRY